MTFISYAEPLKKLLSSIVLSEELHAKWLNTLSYLENCGAKKIAACEHPTLVKKEMLKHAAEEFRHAHHLKRQIEKISSINIDTYALPNVLGGTTALQYLNLLDLGTSRYLKKFKLSKNNIKEISYLLVTYAIERRADELYHIYDQILKEKSSRVNVKCILLEEQEHLNEMIEGLNQIPSGMFYANFVCMLEANLCEKWISALEHSLQQASFVALEKQQ